MAINPPNYAPGMTPQLANHPFGAVLSMFGMPLMQQMAGPTAFVPQFTPAQALFDQYQGFQHQRNTMQAVGGVNKAAQEQLASRFLGLRSLVTDSPATALNKEQASQFAAIANNPFAKAIAGTMIGPENLEALMFGRKGDPTALASSVARMGFSRADAATGDKRMSGQSMSRFSQNMYEQLYGKSADLGDAHGFMASQTGALVEDLFQRGSLPKALGKMSAADRVKAIGSGSRDSATMDRLARQFGHEEMLKDDKYAKATDIEQEKMLDANVGKYRKRLDSTFKEIDRFRASDPRAKSAQDIEKMEGFGTAANHVDAERVSGAAKKYLGAVDAIREIFGDSGRGDAPMQELMQALEHLSNGTIGQIGTDKVESTLRSMRLAARDAGVGLEQLNGMSHQISAQGDMLGLAAPLSTQTTLQALQSQKAMRDAGAFSGSQWGRMDINQATMESATRINRGKASEVGKSMAALNRMVTENPDKYAGTELEAAMKAYNDPNSGGVYEFDGQKYDLGKTMGEQGRAGALGILERSGGNSSAFDTFYRDKGTQEYYREGLEKTAQKAEMTGEVGNSAVAGAMTDRTGTDAFRSARGYFQSEADFERERNSLVEGASGKFADVIINETGGMSQKERAEHLEKRSVDVMAEVYREQGMSQRAAERRARQMRDAMFGGNEDDRREAFSQLASEANQYVEQRTGQELAGNEQLYGDDVLEGERRIAQEHRAESEHNKKLSHGKKSSMVQRASEALEKLGTDTEYTGSQAAKDIIGGIDIAQMDPAGAAEQAAASDLAGTVGAEAEFGPGGGRSAMLDMAQMFVSASEGTVRFADEGVAAFGLSRIAGATGLSRGTLAAQRVANSAVASSGIAGAMRGVARWAPGLSLALGGLGGAIEGAQNGRGMIEGALLGMTTGDASTGSMFSGALGLEEGGTADKSLGVLGATATGALTGAAIGSIIPGIGTAVGAGVGAGVGMLAEAYKWATESDPVAAANEASAVGAAQSTAHATATTATRQEKATAGHGKENLDLTGTLSLRGLQEAILSATGTRPMETPGAGSPVFET